MSKRLAFIFVGLFTVLCAGLCFAVGADATSARVAQPPPVARVSLHKQALRALGVDFPLSAQVPLTTPTQIRTNTPTITGTATPTSTRLPDLTASISWLPPICTGPGLHLVTIYANGGSLHPPAGPTTMQLQNSIGETLDFPVPQLTPQSQYVYDCAYGSCLPASWLAHMPFALTVDVYDQVHEHDETNNVAVLTSPPPPLPPCDTVTVTPTQTGTSTTTNSPTETQTGTPNPTYTSTRTNTSTSTRVVTGTPTSTGTYTPTGTPTTCTPPSFSDVHPTDYYYEAVRYLGCQGAISGYADGTFRPYNTTTRAQVCKIVVVGFSMPLYVPSAPTFCDVPLTHPFAAYIYTAAHYDIVSGYSDCSFRPYNNVTRGQLSKIVTIAGAVFKGWQPISPQTATFSDVPVGNPFHTFVETVYCHGVISGYADGTFRPEGDATRGQISKVVFLSLTRTVYCSPALSAPAEVSLPSRK